MKEANALSFRQPKVIFLSFFGIGLIPKAPGTMASLAVIPLLYGLGKLNIPFLFYFPSLLLAIIFSCFIVESFQKKAQIHDPSWIVIDEVLGMATIWPFSQSPHLTHLAVLFFLFRFFDIVKVWPASFFDQRVKHGMGVIVDDLISALYGGLAYCAIYFLFPF